MLVTAAGGVAGILALFMGTHFCVFGLLRMNARIYCAMYAGSCDESTDHDVRVLSHLVAWVAAMEVCSIVCSPTRPNELYMLRRDVCAQ